MTEEKIGKVLKWTVYIVIISCIITICYFYTKSEYYEKAFIKKGLIVENLSNLYINDSKIYAKLTVFDSPVKKDLWCISTDSEDKPSIDDNNWQKIIDNQCDMLIHENDKYLYIRDRKIIGDRYNLSDYVSFVSKIETDKDNIKLIKNESDKITVTTINIGKPNVKISYKSNDENIAKVENGEITGIDDGITSIMVLDNYGHSKEVKVQVTSLITMPTINNRKPFISNKQYTEDEAHILDDYLFYEVDKAGYQTRAGVVAAARFLTMQLKYRIPYFIENGRTYHYNHQKPYCDGEGRYYHRGLYLSEDKFQEIEKSVSGPAMWGAYIKEWSEDNGIIRNGLDCSGFVCWCLLNGGFDFGDIGAGLSEGFPTVSDRGVSHRITMDYLKTHSAKAGDPIGFDGHIGIIVGVDNENELIYVADELYHSMGSWVQEYTYQGLVRSHFTHIYDYTDEYKNEGNYTSMW